MYNVNTKCKYQNVKLLIKLGSYNVDMDSIAVLLKYVVHASTILIEQC